MLRKNTPQIFYEASVNWLSDNRGIVHAHEVHDTIHVTAPAIAGGSGKEWSAEHLLLAAVISCYMNTYLSFCRKMNFAISHFECNAIGQVAQTGAGYQFTHINVYPRIIISDESLRSNAAIAAEKTQHHCLVSKSINANFIYHTEILTKPLPAATTAAEA